MKWSQLENSRQIGQKNQQTDLYVKPTDSHNIFSRLPVILFISKRGTQNSNNEFFDKRYNDLEKSIRKGLQ